MSKGWAGEVATAGKGTAPCRWRPSRASWVATSSAELAGPCRGTANSRPLPAGDSTSTSTAGTHRSVGAARLEGERGIRLGSPETPPSPQALVVSTQRS